jgi:hypothetical protein
MKQYAKILTAAVIIGFSGAASAANSLKAGSMALNLTATGGETPVNSNLSNDMFIVQGKYFLQKDLAILAGVGLGVNGSDAKGTDFGIRAGTRKYLKTNDFAPFFGGFFGYSSTNDSNTKSLQLMAEFGAEYFMSKQFSIEGAARAGYVSYEYPQGATTFKGTYVGTASAGFSVNFYF